MGLIVCSSPISTFRPKSSRTPGFGENAASLYLLGLVLFGGASLRFARIIVAQKAERSGETGDSPDSFTVSGHSVMQEGTTGVLSEAGVQTICRAQAVEPLSVLQSEYSP